MARDDVADDGRKERKRVDHLPAEERMGLEHGALGGIERAVLLEHAVRHSDLADVVENEGVPEIRLPCESRRDRRGQLDRTLGNAPYVLARLEISDPESGEHGVDDDVRRIDTEGGNVA